MKKKVLLIICSLWIISALLVAGCTTQAPAPAPGLEPGETPESILMVVTRTGSLSHVIGVGIASVIEDATGVKFGLIPVAKTKARAVLMRESRADFALSPAMDPYIALQGTYDFADWGPQSVRTIWDGGFGGQGLATRGNSGIKTLADIRGKRVADYPTYPVVQLYMDGFYAYTGLTRNDVIVTPVSDFTSGQAAILEGSVDVAVASAASAGAYELEASVHGIHWLEMPASETEAWARLKEIVPSFHPAVFTSVAGASEDNPKELFAQNFQVQTYDWTNENLVYWFVKQLHENYDGYKGTHASLVSWTLEQSLKSDDWFVPRHEGTIRYYKDIGVWTDKMEEKQKELLEKYPQNNTR